MPEAQILERFDGSLLVLLTDAPGPASMFNESIRARTNDEHDMYMVETRRHELEQVSTR